MPEEILKQLSAYSQRLAAKQAVKERAVINSHPRLAVRLYSLEKEVCGLPPTRELLARLVRSTLLRAKGVQRIVS